MSTMYWNQQVKVKDSDNVLSPDYAIETSQEIVKM